MTVATTRGLFPGDRVRVKAAPPRRAPKEDNRLREEDRPAHDWYRFVLSYPPHLVRDYLARLEVPKDGVVLDPFCGTGTTIVECKKLGFASIGLEANSMPAFACRVKSHWDIDHRSLVQAAEEIADEAGESLAREGLPEPTSALAVLAPPSPRGALRSLPLSAHRLLLANSISPVPLHRALVLQEAINRRARRKVHDHLRLALARSLVNDASNLHFGPEVGVGPAKPDAPIIEPWLRTVRAMARDVAALKDQAAAPATVHQADSRFPMRVLRPGSIDAVITSPPYPNEKDYTRTTRLESVILGFVGQMHDVRALKKTLVRSNTRSVYRTDDDHDLVKDHKEIQRIANAIEKRRIDMRKTSGFERMYHRVTRLYFGGMARHLGELRAALRPGAMLAYVVGDQASYLRVMIRTGELLAGIAKGLGYEVVGIDLFRTRLATATREQLREEVVVLRWPRKSAR